MANGMRRCGIDPKLYIPWAFVLSGPPGTGKTTTARKVGKLFYGMGFLSPNEVVMCSVTNLVNQYLGRTGPKVVRQFELGLGIVLFFDEAYRLAADSYHKDAVGEIVDTMMNSRYARNMVVILAIYSGEMETLLSTNPGLRSRFPTISEFPPMTLENCLYLLSKLLAKLNISMSKAITEHGGRDNTSILGILEALTSTGGWASGRDIASMTRLTAEHVFPNVSESEEVREPGTLQISFDDLVACLMAMLKQKGATWSLAMGNDNYPELTGR
ncbi:hypothetical protein ACHAQI_010595 [Fusarium lateritium]